jgi:hypothetical protein
MDYERRKEMKKTILGCLLGMLMLGLLSATQAAAFSYLGAAVLGNSGDQAEIDFLNNWIEPDQPKSALIKISPIDWSSTDTYQGVAYVLLKTGNLKLDPTNYDTFAFRIDLGQAYTNQQLIEAMAGILNTTFSLDLTVDEWKGKASHFSVVNAVPIPAAAWLFGSGLVGLLGIRMRRRRG